jgi:hypothetical protein
METLSVQCNHCGAPLEVGVHTRFVTCQFCNSSLEVKRTESTVFTEEVARIAENSEKMADSLEIITLQNEIERLDREWSASQPVSPGGGERWTSAGGGVAGLVFSVFFALVCFGMAGMAGSHGAPGFFVLVVVGMGIFALVTGVMAFFQSQKSSENLDLYQRRRADMIRKLERMKNGGSGFPAPLFHSIPTPRGGETSGSGGVIP